MESEAWFENLLLPISLGAEDQVLPKQQLYKDISELRITPDEGTTGDKHYRNIIRVRNIVFPRKEHRNMTK